MTSQTEEVQLNPPYLVYVPSTSTLCMHMHTLFTFPSLPLPLSFILQAEQIMKKIEKEEVNSTHCDHTCTQCIDIQCELYSNNNIIHGVNTGRSVL